MKGIPLKDSFQIKRNYMAHLRSKQQIRRRKPASPSQPKRLPRYPVSQRINQQKYKPFLNYSSSLVNLKYYYDPTYPQSSLRIFNQNRAIGERLETIINKPIRRQLSPQNEISKTTFTQTVRQRFLQSQNLKIAKRILNSKSKDIDSASLEHHFQNHQFYSKLRSNNKSGNQFFTPQENQENPERLIIGSGAFSLTVKIQDVKFKGFLPKADDLFCLRFKVKGAKKAYTQMLGFQQFKKTQFTAKAKRSQLRRKGFFKLKLYILQIKVTEEIEQGYFLIEVDRYEFSSKGSRLQKQSSILRRNGFGNGVVRAEVLAEERGRDRGVSMQEQDQEYEESSDQQYQ